MQNALALHSRRFWAAGFVLSSCLLSAGAQQVHYSSEHREGERTLPQTVDAVKTASATLKAKLGAGRTPVSLAVADFDTDGSRDLLSGYAAGKGGVLLMQRGSPLALAPTPHEWAMTARGELVPPFVAKAEAIDVPVRPDFLLTADINGHGHSDLIVAAKGDSALHLLFSHGNGSFAAPKTVPLAGAIEALTTWTDPAGNNLVVAGICGASGCGLQFLDREGQTKAWVHTTGAVTAIQTGAIDGGPRQDLLFLADGKPSVLDGDTALSNAPVVETLPLVHGAALAVGYFVADRRGYQQIAVLGTDATLHVFTRAGVDSTVGSGAERAAAQKARYLQMLSGERPSQRPMVKRTGLPWAEVETLSNIGPGGESSILLRAKLTTGGNDDLAVLEGNQYVTVAHTVIRDGARVTTTPVVTIDSSNTPVTAALATRVSADARSGIVALNSGVNPLSITQPPTYKTYTVNTTADGNDDLTTANRCVTTGAGAPACTLRDAVNLANHDRATTSPGNPAYTGVISKSDVINVPAGTYTLSVRNPTAYGSTTQASQDPLGSVNYHLEVDASVNIVGAGSASTIVNGNNLDQVFTVDFGSYAATSSSDFESPQVDVFFSGMTVENGKNPNNYSLNLDSNPYGGNMYWEAEPSSNLVLNNVVLTGGTSAAASATDIGGGGIAAGYDATNASNTAGALDIENSSITNNKDVSGEGGGGIAVLYAVPLTLISDTITGNTTTGEGGGVHVDEDGTSSATTVTNSNISTNTASGAEGYGGGLVVRGALTMAGTTVNGNAAHAYGGGLYLYNSINGSASGLTGSITASTFTNNSLTGTLTGPTYPQDGGGVCIAGANTLGGETATVQYSRFHGNTVTDVNAVTGLAVGCDSQISSSNKGYAVVTATNNWWGCNGAATGTGCDTAHAGNVTSATLTLTPYTTLTLALSSTTPTLNSSLTATASLGQNSSGSVYSAANDIAYLATPISAFSLTNTGTVTYTPSATAFGIGVVSASVSNAAATATGTVSTSGSGTATVTVDGATVTAGYTVPSPPVANPQSVTVAFNTAKAITLSATNSPTGYTVVTGPSHGTLSGTAPNLTYTPNANYSGSDSFTFTANNNGGTSNTATVSITVTPGTPTANSQSVNVAFNTATAVTLTGSDPDSPALALTYTVVTAPTHGTLSGTAPNLTYTPNANYQGSDSFTFRVSNGTNNSNTATVTLTVAPGTPTANSQSVSVPFNTAKAITLTGSDPDTPALALTYTVVTAPTHGTLSGTAPNLTYTPNANYQGSDSFTFRVSNGTNNSNTATVILNVAPGTPTANSQSVNVAFNTATPVTLTGSDPDSPALSLTYTVVTSAAHGTLSGTAPNLTYTPAAGYFGSDSFTFRVNNGTNSSSPATVSLTIMAPVPAKLAVTGLGTFTAPQMSGTVTVTAQDTSGNTATNFTGTVTLSSTDSSASFSPSSYTYVAGDNGSHTFTVTFNTAGTQTVTATSGALTGSESGILVQDAIWILNASSTLTRTTDTGVQTTTAGSSIAAATYGALAFDNTGNVWTATGTGTVQEYNRAGVNIAVSGNNAAGVSAPTSLFIDGLGQVWVTNNNSTVSELSNSGTAISPNTGYRGGGMSDLSGILVDSSGAVWVTNRGNNSVTKIFGAAAPVVTPTVTGTTNNTLGTRP